MTISEVLQLAKTRLENEESVLAAEVLLAYVLGKTREDIFIHDGEVVAEDKLNLFKTFYKRFYKGEPVAYLINNKEFYGLDFYVDGSVLIPRPETEMLVDKVVQFVKRRSDDADFADGLVTILDVGTGCGNIAVSLAKNLEDVHVTAVDKAAGAIEVAKKNAVNNGVQHKIDFACSDLLNSVIGEYDIVVANLPYIGEKKHRYVSKEAYDFEPHEALFGGDNGLYLYEKLFRQIGEKGWVPDLILGEFGFLQGEEMRTLLSKYFVQESWDIEKDLASIERIFVVKSS